MFDSNSFSLDYEWSVGVTLYTFPKDAPAIIAGTRAGHVTYQNHTYIAVPIFDNMKAFLSRRAAEYYILSMAHEYIIRRHTQERAT